MISLYSLLKATGKDEINALHFGRVLLDCIF